MDYAVLYFTPGGQRLSQGIVSILSDARVFVYDKTHETAADFVKEAFLQRRALIFIGATGIAVRLIAPLLRGKDSDPPVVVLDEGGRFVIPLVSGHIGGANDLALHLARPLRATPVITTATDVNQLFAVDSWAVSQGLVIGEIGRIKAISAALLAGESVGFSTAFPIEGPCPRGLTEQGDVGISVDIFEKNPFATTLHLYPKAVRLGVGCKRDTEYSQFRSFVLDQLKEQNIALKAVCGLYSLDLKANEGCIIDFSREFSLPFTTYTAEKLMELEGVFTTSSFVSQTTGVDCVCERAAMMAGGRLLLKKTAKEGKTIAMAVVAPRLRFP